jgi:hypothetical protein
VIPRYLKVTYDVSKLTDEQIGQLQLEAVVQAEASDTHPGVKVVDSLTFVYEPDPQDWISDRAGELINQRVPAGKAWRQARQEAAA